MGSWKGPRGGDKPSGPALFTPPPQARARARGVEPPSRPGSRLRGLRGCWGSRPAWLLGLPNVFSLGLVGPSCGASTAPSSGPRCLSRGKAGGSTPQVPEARWRGSASVLPAALPKQPPWPQGHLRGWHCPLSPPSCLQLPPPSGMAPCFPPLPLAASRAVGREELRTWRTGGSGPALLSGGPVCIPWCSLSAADVPPQLGADARVHVCACLSDV